MGWSTSTDYSEWKSSKLIDGENECSIAFLKNQTVIMNCRTGHHSRDLLYWSRNGELISHVNHPELVDPDCQGSIISFNESLYISGNDDPNDRVNMRVKKSTDQGQSWEKVETVWSGYGGYSQLVGVGDHMH